jgi:hypothetical protein
MLTLHTLYDLGFTITLVLIEVAGRAVAAYIIWQPEHHVRKFKGREVTTSYCYDLPVLEVKVISKHGVDEIAAVAGLRPPDAGDVFPEVLSSLQDEGRKSGVAHWTA